MLFFDFNIHYVTIIARFGTFTNSIGVSTNIVNTKVYLYLEQSENDDILVRGVVKLK